MLNVLLLLLLALGSDAAGAPLLELPADRTIDLGLIDTDSVHEGSIALRNSGDAPLNILNVSTDCSCTVARFPHRAIAPGDSAIVSVRFDGRDYPPGDFIKMVRIRSNAKNRLVKVFVKGRIRRPSKK